jgi:hypothetical protein
MTQRAKRLLDDFEALPDQERQQVLAELLRRATFGPHELPDDEDLTAAANQVFADLDRDEEQ